MTIEQKVVVIFAAGSASAALVGVITLAGGTSHVWPGVLLAFTLTSISTWVAVRRP